MSIKYSLKFKNLDLTRDINDRLTKLVMPGVISGGELSGVPSQLKVNLAPWKVINRQGMVVEETSDLASLEVQRGQSNIIALRVLYVANGNPIAELEVIEESVFLGLPNLADYIVFGKVIVPIAATEVTEDYIDRTDKMVIDPVGRNRDRGTVTSVSALPAKDNRVGDTMMVCDGVGSPTNLYGWNGFTWIVMTDFVQLQADLTQHRQNIFTNEKHLTDNEKLAVAGTSGNSVNGTDNKLVDNKDTRIPTQNENDALQGSHGNPSSTNKYVTQDFVYAQPTIIPLTSGISSHEITLSQGPVFIGRGGIGSIAQYFRLFHATDDREFLNTDSTTVDVIGVYKDSALSQELTNPSAEPLASIDANGFYIAGSLYLKLNQATTLDSRLIFGKRNTFGNYKVDYLLDNQPKVAQTHRKVIQKFEEVTGREYDDLVPTEETNIELRKELVDVKQFVNANTPSDFIVTLFRKMNKIPGYKGLFEENLDLEEFSFQNSGTAYTYDATSGTVTYSASVDLSNVLASHVFIDGDGKEFPILSKSSPSLVINTRTGQIPRTISTSLTNTTKSGSVKVDNNPRQINLSDCSVVQFRERIPVAALTALINEYHPVTGQIAFEVTNPLRSMVYREPRVRAYGNWQIRNLENPLQGPNAGPKTQAYAVNEARLMVTGIFTDLELVADIKPSDTNSALNFTLIVDGITTMVVDLAAAGQEVSFDSFNRVKQKNYSIVSDLSDGKVHTVEIIIPDFGNEFVFYGFDFIRRNFEQSLISSGRMFVQGDMIMRDTVSNHVLNPVPAFGRGGVTSFYYDRDLNFQNPTNLMTEFDGSLDAPGGAAVAGQNTMGISSGITKFANYYKNNDIVKVATATEEETKILTGTASSVATFNSNLSITGVSRLLHVCSTTGEPVDPTAEVRRISPEMCGLATLSEFALAASLVVDRAAVLEDGVTKFFAQQMSFTNTGVEGYSHGIKFPQASSRLRITACCTHMEIIVATASNTTFSYSINGSPTITKTSDNKGYKRIVLFTNGRFQTYEVDIFNATNLVIAGFIFAEPDGSGLEGMKLGQIKYLARYQATNLNSSGFIDGSNYPIGAIGFDASSSYVRFVNNAASGLIPWTSVLDFSKLWGYYTSTNQTSAFFQFDFYGEAFEFEYTGTNNSGIALIQLNGVIARTSNYPAVYRGINSANGEIDMYSAVPTRKRVGISGLPYGKYQVRVICQAIKNPLSTNTFINVNQIFHANSTGFFGYANQLAKSGSYYLGYSNAYDLRDFGNGIKSIDDMLSLVGQAFGLSQDPVQMATIIDGGTF